MTHTQSAPEAALDPHLWAAEQAFRARQRTEQVSQQVRAAQQSVAASFEASADSHERAAKGVLMSCATSRIYEAPAAAITPVPDLRGAACAGRSDLFDLRPVHSDDRAYREALALCARCPVLDACRAWFASLPAAERPVGVIAGRVNKPRGRPSHDQAAGVVIVGRSSSNSSNYDATARHRGNGR